MGCHTWTYKDKFAFENQHEDTAPFPFLFRVFDYQDKVLTSFKEAAIFVIETFKNSTNAEPIIEPEDNFTSLTYTGKMTGKILFASESLTGPDNLTDPKLTLQRLRDFFEQYPKGFIEFS